MNAQFFKYSAIILMLSMLLIAGCSPDNISSVPSDFLFVMDVKSAGDFEECAVNVNIRIDARGRGRYETYDTNCAIEFDSNHMVTYKRSQVLETGRFRLTDTKLEQLWNAINENNFFRLTEDYRMEMGLSYAFIMVEADDRWHIVNNIGMEVPEMKAIVEATDTILPEGVTLDYGEGFVP